MNAPKTDLDVIKKLVRESDGFITGHYKLEEVTYNLSNEFIVSYETTIGRYFLRCETYLHFYHMVYLKTKYRFFHEIMTTETRKIYFDIDSKESEKEVKKCISELIDSIQVEMKKLDLNFKRDDDVILLTSSNETKQSYHLILPNHFCNRIIDLEYFARKVVERLQDNYQNMIDMSVYKRNQSFRMFGCSKRNEISRILTIDEKDDQYKHIDVSDIAKGYRREKYTKDKWEEMLYYFIFMKSLVSFSDREPKYIVVYPWFELPQRKGKVNTKDRWNVKVPDGLEFDKEIEYDDKYILLYKNVNGYHCPDCNKKHDNENPFVILYKNPKQAFLRCRR